MRVLLALLFLLAAALGAGWTTARRQLAFEGKRVALLQAENARLRDAVATHERASNDETGQRAVIEKAVAQIRGLGFLRPVDYDVVTRETIKQVIAGKIAEQFSDSEMDNMAAGYAAIGLIPRGYPLKQKYIDLLGEQVAAFYDQHRHKLFMFRDSTLGNAQNRIILAHELVHALQDQHFTLKKMPLELKTNDDRVLATSALVEGDATLVMGEFMLQNISWQTMRDSLGGMLTQNMAQLREAPRALREMLLFPYVRGQQFCAALHARDGYGAITAAFKNPPASSAQILHPEKYLSEPREEPIPIAWAEVTVLGEKPVFDNVLGEFGVRVLLADKLDGSRAESIASGWRGDRYLVYQRGDALVWKAEWRDEASATAFASVADQVFKGCIAERDGTATTVIVAARPEWQSALSAAYFPPSTERKNER